MNLGLFISLVIFFVIIFIFLFFFLFYYLWSSQLKNKITKTKEILIKNKEFWQKIPNDFLYNIYKRNPNINKEDLINAKELLLIFKNSLNNAFNILNDLNTNINKLSFFYFKKTLKKIINSKNSIISISILIVKNIEKNLVCLENKNSKLINQFKRQQLLKQYKINDPNELYNLIIKKEAIYFILYSINIYMKNNDDKTYSVFFKKEVKKLFKNKNELNIFQTINKYISFFNKARNFWNIEINKNILFTKNINLLNEEFLKRSFDLINWFSETQNEKNKEFQEIYEKSKEFKNKIIISNFFWTNFEKIIKNM